MQTGFKGWSQVLYNKKNYIDKGGSMDDFVSSKAMVTPGVAGSATTMITGTLVNIFGFPGAVTALAVSFVFGLLSLTDKTIAISLRLILYIINSMTIFSVAIGLNQTGMEIIQRDRPVTTIERSLIPDQEDQANSSSSDSKQFFQDWF